jgi:MarR family transcriptional regulator for hemolysin
MEMLAMTVRSLSKKNSKVRKAPMQKPQGQPRLRLPSQTALGYHLRLTSEDLRACLQQEIEPQGVRLAQWQYLRALWDCDGLSQSELSARVSRMGSNTVTALNILEKNGLIRRKRSTTDRRVIHVYLTEKAKAKQDKLIGSAVSVMRQATEAIGDDDLLTTLRTLKAIQNNLAKLRRADAAGFLE